MVSTSGLTGSAVHQSVDIQHFKRVPVTLMTLLFNPLLCLSPPQVLLFVSGGKQLHTHANRQAPRCLPCNYTDPAEEFWEGLPDQYTAPWVGVLDASILPSAVLCFAVLCC